MSSNCLSMKGCGCSALSNVTPGRLRVHFVPLYRGGSSICCIGGGQWGGQKSNRGPSIHPANRAVPYPGGPRRGGGKARA